jgi:hypothetical protein
MSIANNLTMDHVQKESESGDRLLFSTANGNRSLDSIYFCMSSWAGCSCTNNLVANTVMHPNTNFGLEILFTAKDAIAQRRRRMFE